MREVIISSMLSDWRQRRYVDIDHKAVLRKSVLMKHRSQNTLSLANKFVKAMLADSRKDTFNFLFFLRVIDFSLHANANYGYTELAKNFRRIFASDEIFKYFSRIKVDEFARDLKLSEPPALSKMRLSLVRESADWLSRNWMGNFFFFFDAHSKSVKDFCFELMRLKKFRDFYVVRNKPIYVLKPNQLLYLESAFASEYFGISVKLTGMTVYADNVLPAILHRDGVLRYAPLLKRRIYDGEKILPGSRMEREIRIGTVLACEEIAKETGFEPWVIDQMLWHDRGEKKYIKHKTITPYY